MFKNFRSGALYVALTLGLVACGGGGGGGGGTSLTGPAYSGSTSPAAVSSTNAEPLGKAATDAAVKSVSSEAATGSPLLNSVSTASDSSVPTSKLIMLTAKIAKQALVESQNVTQSQLQSSLLAAVITSDQLNQEMMTDVFCGGSITVPDNTTVSGNTIDVTMTFNNLCYTDGLSSQVVMNGAMRLIETGTSVTVIFDNLTISVDGQTYTLDASSTCDSSGLNCTVDFEGSDGTVYRMGDLNVSEDVSGFYVSGTFYHPDYGSVTLSTTTPMTFNCAPSPQPDSGELAFTGVSSSGRIIFDSCLGYTYCYTEGAGPEVCDVGVW